jgi:hypothetical protein
MAEVPAAAGVIGAPEPAPAPPRAALDFRPAAGNKTSSFDWRHGSTITSVSF